MRKIRTAVTMLSLASVLLVSACSKDLTANSAGADGAGAAAVAPNPPIQTTKNATVAALLPQAIRDKGELKAAGNIPYPPLHNVRLQQPRHGL